MDSFVVFGFFCKDKKGFFMFFHFFAIFLVLSSCQASSLDDFRYEGASQVRLLIEDLKGVESREDLVDAAPLLKKRFEKIVDLMIQSRVYQQKNPGLEISFYSSNQALSDSLLEQMKRVYALEGGKECIEKAQREAMLRLDAKEKTLENSKKHFTLAEKSY